MTHRIGVDIGGTFTDLVVETVGGATRLAKVLSTSEDLSNGVLHAVEAAAVDLDEVELFIHGTTAGINSLLERRGARVALVTTRGFRDSYLIGRGHRPDMYNLRYRKPEPLLERDAIFEVDERLAADGEVLVPLDPNSVDTVAKLVAERDFEAVAVSLLHSYVRPDHELQVRERLSAALDVPVVLSHQAAAEWREYERTSTTVIAAYIAPVVRRYLRRISDALAARGLRVPLHITQSNGGAMSATVAADRALLTLYSGPVGGVVAGREVGRRLQQPDLICVDMGGTSFDVSLVREGEVALQSEFELQGLPILAPAVELVTIGAGGGSIVWEERGGLRVGPQSAGSTPGPACYGRGGTRPTVSDANAVLGRLPPQQRLAGSLELDRDAAARALGDVAERLGLDPVALAEQALEVAHFKMAEAIRELTVERGLAPGDFSLAAFGGAGPLHAAFLAEELDIDRVIIPALPGAFSAWGMLQGDLRHDVVGTFFRSFEEADRDLRQALEWLRGRIAELVESDGADPEAVRYEASAELRYRGQEYSLLVPLPAPQADEALRAAFHAAYRQRYGHAQPDASVEFVALRLAGTVTFDRTVRPASPATTATGGPLGTAEVVFSASRRATPVFRREDLAGSIDGPAIVIEQSTTTVVPEGWRLRPGTDGHLLLTRGEQR